MSRRNAGAAGNPARPARARLQATLGGPRPLLLAGDGEPEFEYQGPDESSRGYDAAGKGEAVAGPAVRWRLGLRVAAALGIIAVLAAAVFWWQTASGQPQILPLSGISPGSRAPAEGDKAEAAETSPTGPPDGVDPSTTAASSTVVVHVAGAVASPGVVRLPAGSRVHEAITAAGGGLPDADLNRLNLALVVQDAQKIHVPVRGEAPPPEAAAGEAPGTAGGGTGSPGAKINLNTADAAELDALPKVGPVLAQRIVDWRKEHGAFKSVEELDAVDGVGPKMLEALLPLVTV
jgi:competence protein ComEA